MEVVRYIKFFFYMEGPIMRHLYQRASFSEIVVKFNPVQPNLNYSDYFFKQNDVKSHVAALCRF